ncbi:hypothetical protein JRQ81_008471 [Phrynocephalus forsythii]|uniref:Endonuclease n=1 Tax=Phrynocephalus forsythii TaxID=171643 RepID=A0A9Q1AS34_9SAUR|nr:hypothetical protein JRQ81_008471 [Phrynocephalus forsythii]
MPRACNPRRWLVPAAASLALGGLGLGLGLGAGGWSWRPQGQPPQPSPEGLLARLPVVPVVAAAAASSSPLEGEGGFVVAPRGGAELAKYGLPGFPPQLRSRASYVLGYDPRTRLALWVVEQLEGATASDGGGGGGGSGSSRDACRFLEDDSVHEYHRATNGDYRASGYHRGHLAAAANHRGSQEAMRDTFYLSNVAPQNPHLNQNAWNNLEKYCRSLTKYNKNVYVCTGPLFLPRMEPDGKMYVKYQVIGKNHVAVPTHFFKVLILEKMGRDRVALLRPAQRARGREDPPRKVPSPY